MTGLIILASIIGLGAIGSMIVLLVQCYNRLMKARVAVDQQFANIDIFLKQRADEIPELVKILKASMNYEKDKIDGLMNAYLSYQNSKNIDDKLEANHRMITNLNMIIAHSSQADFVGLKQRLTEVETQLAQRREMFNDSVAIFNVLILKIPYILIAAMLNIHACKYLEISEAEKAYHSVDL